MKSLLPFLLFLASSPLYAQAPKVAEVIAMEYPPYVSAHLADNGSSVRLLREQLQQAGWQLHIKFYPPARATAETAKSTGWHLSFMPPHENPQVEMVVFGPAKIHYSFFRLKQSTPFVWHDLTELKGRRLATIRPFNNNLDNEAFTKAGMGLVYVDNIEQGFLMVQSKRADYFLTAEDTGWYYLQKMQLDPNQFQFAQTSIRTYDHTIYLNRNSPDSTELYQALTAKK